MNQPHTPVHGGPRRYPEIARGMHRYPSLREAMAAMPYEPLYEITIFGYRALIIGEDVAIFDGLELAPLL